MRIQGQSKAILSTAGSNAYPIYATGDITINDSDVTAASAKQAFNKGGKIIPASGKAMRVDQGDAQASATQYAVYTAEQGMDDATVASKYVHIYPEHDEAHSPAAQVFGHTLTLGGVIGVNTYLVMGEAITGSPEDYQVEFWNGGELAFSKKVSEVVPVTKENGSTSRTVYGFTFTTVAKEMDTESAKAPSGKAATEPSGTGDGDGSAGGVNETELGTDTKPSTATEAPAREGGIPYAAIALGAVVVAVAAFVLWKRGRQ